MVVKTTVRRWTARLGLRRSGASPRTPGTQRFVVPVTELFLDESHGRTYLCRDGQRSSGGYLWRAFIAEARLTFCADAALETVALETVALETVDLETVDLETVDLETVDLETVDGRFATLCKATRSCSCLTPYQDSLSPRIQVHGRC